ncbi:MAG TPA: S46 family peptidase [Pyrinomonadaceae bacterium]|nr:S46 family peptidase [Pyrinomonadaceae bacterium]
MTSTYSRATVLLLAVLIFVSLVPIPVLSDEGMFLPDTLSQLPLKKLQQRGLKIPITDIYNPNGPSIKDAVVIVDGGTGEFLSPDGLMLTNHHVAFDALVAASDSSKDYATNGYLAHNHSEELPAKGYTVQITQELKDVTGDVLSGVTDATSPQDRAAAILTKTRALAAANAKPAEGITANVLPLNEGLSYYLFTYLTLRDVRIVYAPPKNIGFFGGDPDNFEWPRHDGDFTFMRAYVGSDGKPAQYAATNVAYKPKKFLSISMGGVKENDFVMVMGYPGLTKRYRESYSVAYNQNVIMPFSIDIFNKRIEELQNAGKNKRELQIQLQSRIFEISNTLKDLEGSVLAMQRAGIVEQKRADEVAFTRWVNGKPERQKKYGEVLPSLRKAYDELTLTGQRDLVVQQLAGLSDVFQILSLVKTVAAEKEKPQADRNSKLVMTALRARGALPEIFADRNAAVERDMFAFLLRKAADLPAGQKIDAVEKLFGKLQADARVRAEEDFARTLTEGKNFATTESVNELFEKTPAQLKELHEPLIDFADEVGDLAAEIGTSQLAFSATVSRWRPLLVTGMSEMHVSNAGSPRGQPAWGASPYPDANRTLRFTYGDVKGYVPHDAAIYQPFTNLSGVIEKDTGREPFDVPVKLKQLYRARDFGPYATPDGQNVPVNFLSTTDIIGGNSGSPIMNGRGEQVGIIFDGNYEGLGNDFFYNDAKGRSIAVDIRYVLFIADKFGGAGYILKELDIKNAPASMRARAAGLN